VHAISFLVSISLFTTTGLVFPLWSKCLLLLALYTLIVESFYSFRYSDFRPLVHPLFYFYNFVVSVAFYNFFVRARLSGVNMGIVVTSFVALLGVFVFGFSLVPGIGARRAVGTFNNPNQLGYFSVCLASSIFLLFRLGSLKYSYAITLFGIAGFLSIASLSKAAMISVSVFFIILLLPKKWNFQSILVFLLLLACVSSAIFYLFGSGYIENTIAYNRISGIRQETDSSLESRGYFTSWDADTTSFILGMGAGRVQNQIGHEVHSTMASALVSYGVVGFLLLSTLMILWARSLFLSLGLVTFLGVWLPPFLYGITHNGTRFTFFWILFSMSIAASKMKDGRI